MNNDQTASIQPEEQTAREDRPWAIRSMPGAVIDSAVSAAKRQRLTVGEWLAVAIRREIEAERQTANPTIEGQLLPPGIGLITPQPPTQTQDGLAWLVTFHDLIRRHGELRADGKPAPKLVAKMERRLRDLL